MKIAYTRRSCLEVLSKDSTIWKTTRLLKGTRLESLTRQVMELLALGGTNLGNYTGEFTRC